MRLLRSSGIEAFGRKAISIQADAADADAVEPRSKYIGDMRPVTAW